MEKYLPSIDLNYSYYSISFSTIIKRLSFCRYYSRKSLISRIIYSRCSSRFIVGFNLLLIAVIFTRTSFFVYFSVYIYLLEGVSIAFIYSRRYMRRYSISAENLNELLDMLKLLSYLDCLI